MILISSVAYDNTTSEVIDWLTSFQARVCRLNCDFLTTEAFDHLLPVTSDFGNFVTSVWVRKEGSKYVVR